MLALKFKFLGFLRLLTEFQIFLKSIFTQVENRSRKTFIKDIYNSDTNSSGRLFLYTKQFSVTPAAYPTVYLSSDTVYLRWCQIPQVKGSILQE